jgi:hypothetical protein
MEHLPAASVNGYYSSDHTFPACELVPSIEVLAEKLKSRKESG